MSKIKDMTPIEKAWKVLNDDIKDRELQDRFDGFKRTEAGLVEQYNKLVPVINALASQASHAKHVVVESAKLGILAKDAVDLLKSTETELGERSTEIAHINEKLEEERALIKKYKEGTESKLFDYWQMLRAIDGTVEPWISFKDKYKDRIF